MTIDMSLQMRSLRTEGAITGRAGLAAGVAAGVLVLALAAPTASVQTPATLPPGYHPEKDTSVTAVNQRPDANRMMQMRRMRLDEQRFVAANLERMRQLSADSARLLQIAAEVNAELGKTGEANLEMAAKVDAIEKLAHGV